MEMVDIEHLAELTRRYGLEEIELERRGERVRVRRRAEGSILEVQPAAEDHPAALPSPPPLDGAKGANPPLGTPIPSPMVGTFYRSPAPGQPAFVEVGSAVTPATTVCVIEAMKVVNEVPADMAGTIVEVLAKDGQAVEFGQPLFRVL